MGRPARTLNAFDLQRLVFLCPRSEGSADGEGRESPIRAGARNAARINGRRSDPPPRSGVTECFACPPTL